MPELKPWMLISKEIAEVRKDNINVIAVIPAPSNIALYFEQEEEKLLPNTKPKEPANNVAVVTSGITTMNASENTNPENSNEVMKLQIEKAMVDFLRMGVIWFA